MRRIAASLFSAVLAGCASTPRAPPEAGAVLRDLHERNLFMGAVTISVNGVVVHESAHGFADLDSRRPFTPQTPGDGGSIAKTFTATTVLALAAEGRIDLDAPVSRYVPAFPHATTRVRHLLAHTAGLPGYEDFEKRAAGQPLDNRAFVALVARDHVAPAFPPGTRFEYDNVAYDIAALVIEAVTGTPYAEAIAARYLRPLGMDNAFVRPARFADWPSPRTRGYRYRGGEWKAADAYDGEGFHGGGNLYVSARDVHRWAEAHARGQVHVPGALVPSTLSDGRKLGLTLGSWYADGGSRGYYLGEHEGFHTLAYWDRERRIAIGLVSNSGMPQPLKPALARYLVALAEGRAAPPPHLPEPSTPAADLRGTYTSSSVGTMRVDSEGGRLRLTPPAGVAYPMFELGWKAYYVPGLDATLTFEPPGTLRWSSLFVQGEAHRVEPR